MTLDEVKDRSTVVRPLIDEGQTFDIFVNVWARDHTILQNRLPSESLLFSGRAFQNVTLKDKGRIVQASFKVPTYIFKASETLTNFDIRASFTLAPNYSPSLLDNVVGMSSWIPFGITMPSSFEYVGRPWTLSEKVVDQYSIHVPLIEFHPIASRCTTATEDDSDYMNESETEMEPEGPLNYHTNAGAPALKSHPYIVTRSHIRVVDFTKVLNLERFNQTHQEFKQSSCGQHVPNGTIGWHRCTDKSVLSGDGFWKTSLLKLAVPDHNGEIHTEWAYSPYISAIRYPRGPLDLLPVPVNREKCHDVYPPDESDVDVNWIISFSGESPVRTYLGDVIGSINGYFTVTDSYDRLEMSQLIAQNMHGFYGQPYYEGAQPLIYIIIDYLNEFVNMIESMLQLLYWYSRVSTVGISLSGLFLFALSEVIHNILHGMFNAEHNVGLPPNIHIYLMQALSITGPFWPIISLYKLKVAMRLQAKGTGVIQRLERLPASHAERASSRMDAQLSWKIKFLFILSLALIFFYSQIIPLVDYTSLSLTAIMRLLAYSLFYTASISQIVLNYKSHKFASMYKTTAYLSAYNSLFFLLSQFFIIDNGVHPINLCATCVRIVMAFQAFWYPYARNSVAEDED
ncbi:hypothetical protein BDQ17DRAFT_235588 [Cyathus striatus]|nr:hypothetical protein BDQ17DRAFT_235588 [Cyathus striatus]